MKDDHLAPDEKALPLQLPPPSLEDPSPAVSNSHDVETSHRIPDWNQETSAFHSRILVSGGDSSGEIPAEGKSIAGFRLLHVLGEGGFGTVYCALDHELRRKVALKVLRPRALAEPGAQDRFLAEARALASIHHDNVAPIYQVGCENGLLFIAMPLLAGETLASRIEREGALPNDEVRRIGRETAQGLAAIHAKGLVHRDLKPANIWLEAGSGRVKVLDLGLAHDPLTPLTEFSGTPPYMSPEQANGAPIDFRADLFSLGTVLYECATGRRAYAGNTPAAALQALREETPTPVQLANPSVPDDIAQIILSLLNKEPGNRPTSARDVAAAFAIVGESPDLSTQEGRATFQPWQWIALAATLLVVGSIVSIGYFRSSNSSRVAPQPLPVLIAPEIKVAPLQVASFEVHHFATVDGNNVRPRGVFGKQSFGAARGDEFTVQVKLSKPAYSYLIVYRPDGQNEVLYPQDNTDIPDLTATPHYPAKRRSDRYVLEEGTGLWLVALIVSETPLPSYGEWQALHPNTPWRRSEGKRDMVYWDDGQLIQQLDPSSSVRGSREAPELEPTARLTDWLRTQGPVTVQAIGFNVQ